MKHIATVALMLNLGIAAVGAQGEPVKMTFSGTEGASPIDLKVPDTTTGEWNFAGHGALGQFTFRNIEAEATLPQRSSTCSGPAKLYFTLKIGAGVLRFGDGSLLMVTLTEGSDCIDFAALEAHCIRNFEITGGTGRFKDATGSLVLTETARPLLANAAGNPVFFTATGGFTGTISGVETEEEDRDERQ